MFSAFTSVVAVLLLLLADSLGLHKDVACFSTPNAFPRPHVADCQAAINMIPSGMYNFDGSIFRPLHSELPQSVRARKFLLPAAFRSGTCLILVESTLRHDVWEPHDRTPPVRAASAMFTVVWPKARQYATQITQKCLVSRGKPAAGTVDLVSVLDNFVLHYRITVEGVAPGMKGDGWRVQDWGNIYNVYEANGLSRGRGTKGLWPYSHLCKYVHLPQVNATEFISIGYW